MTLDFDNDELIARIDNLFRLATNHGVYEFDLKFELAPYNYRDGYFLPAAMFSAKTLIIFRISGRRTLCLTLDAINWPSLRVLSLNNLHVENGILENLISSCPLVEEIALLDCFGLKIIRLSGCKVLRDVMVSVIADWRGTLERIEIDLLSLRTFCYVNASRRVHINMNGCKNLEVLKLRYKSMRDHECQDLISKFPRLKILELDCSCGMSVQIMNQQLEKLQLSSFWGMKITTNIPRLQSFQYSLTSSLPSVTMQDRQSNLPVLNIEFRLLPGDGYGALHFCALKRFLGVFNRIECLKLLIVSGNISFQSKLLKDIPIILSLPDVERLKLSRLFCPAGILCESSCKWLILELSSRICIPYVRLVFERKFMELLCKKLMQRVERKQGCAFSRIKWRRRSLKDVQIKHLEVYVETKGYYMWCFLRVTANS